MKLQAARYLGVALWDLDEHSIGYTNIALAAMDAEGKAAQDKERRHKKG